MKNKYKIIILFSLILIFLAYTKSYTQYKDKEDIKNELDKLWNIDINIDTKDKLLVYEKNKSGWYGEQQKFILFKVDTILDFMDTSIFHRRKLPFELIEEVIEIEKILSIRKEDRVDFNDVYFYQKRINYQIATSSESFNDLLYVFLIKENNSWKVYFIEDLNVLDMER